MRKLGAFLFAVTVMATAPWGESVRQAAAQSPIDPQLPVYRPADKLKGTIRLVGSDTMAQVAAVWGEGFRKFHPDVKIEIDVKNSSAAVTAIAADTADFGLLSREMQASELAEFKQKAGHQPLILMPCMEAVGVYVHKDNPLQSLTLDQVDAIFSASLKRGAKSAAKTWGDVGATGEWAKRPIEAHIRSEDTGTQDYIQNIVMHEGDFRKDAHAADSNLDLVKAVAAHTNAICFADSLCELPGVKSVAISVHKGEPATSIDDTGADGRGYPLVRPLQLVVNHTAGEKMSTTNAEFLKYIFSQFGQDDVVKVGFAPVTSRPAHKSLSAAGLGTVK